MQSTQTTLGNELRSSQMMGGMGGLGSQSFSSTSMASPSMASSPAISTSVTSGASSFDQTRNLGYSTGLGSQMGMEGSQFGQSQFGGAQGFGASSPAFNWYQGASLGKMSPAMQPSLGQGAMMQKDIMMQQPSAQVQTLPPKIVTQTVSVPVPTPISTGIAAPRQMGTIHLVHTEKGLKHNVPAVPTGGVQQQAALPPGVLPEHVTEELITEHKIGMKKRRGKRYKVHEENYHRELELARADLLRAAECYKRGDLIQHDEFVAKALAHQKLAERHLEHTYA
jgi:hypothetical protein